MPQHDNTARVRTQMYGYVFMGLRRGLAIPGLPHIEIDPAPGMLIFRQIFAALLPR
jgi:hypothetical protein